MPKVIGQWLYGRERRTACVHCKVETVGCFSRIGYPNIPCCPTCRDSHTQTIASILEVREMLTDNMPGIKITIHDPGLLKKVVDADKALQVPYDELPSKPVPLRPRTDN